MNVPKRVSDRLHSRLKPFLAVLEAQKARDVSEADTVTLVKDLLSEVFGYDKYAELTSEHSIRGTYCDLAISLDGRVQLLIEVKAIGIELKDQHVKQAIDYAANQGVEWVLLTNGVCWQLYHVIFKKPIDKQDLCTVNLLEVNTKSDEDLERLFLLTREGVERNALAEFRDKKDATSRYLLAAILANSERVIAAVRSEIKKVTGLTIDPEVISKTLREQVIKRDTIEGDHADHAMRRLSRSRRSGSNSSNGDDAAKATATSGGAA